MRIKADGYEITNEGDTGSIRVGGGIFYIEKLNYRIINLSFMFLYFHGKQKLQVIRLIQVSVLVFMQVDNC